MNRDCSRCLLGVVTHAGMGDARYDEVAAAAEGRGGEGRGRGARREGVREQKGQLRDRESRYGMYTTKYGRQEMERWAEGGGRKRKPGCLF